MPSTTFAGGALRVSAPEFYDATRAPDGADRGLPGEPGYEAAVSKNTLLTVLRDDDLLLVERVDVTPRRDRDLDDAPAPTGQSTVSLAVDLAADEDAVVLLERDGVYSWHLPTRPTGRTRGLDAHTATFEIEMPPPAVVDLGRKDRGLVSHLVQGAVQAIVFKFVAPAVLGKVVTKLEENARTGLVHLTSEQLSQWEPFETLDELHLPTDRPTRILLFVHGTFSSTVGGFGALALGVAGPAFLAEAVHTYDAVIGYDHKTLSLDPRQNAVDLLERLSKQPASGGVTIDIVTHSRGGLTTRAFVEEVLPQSGWGAVVDKIVFVAATNGGTHLADPERWGDLVDLYTNLGAVAARGLALLPGAAPVVAVVGGALRGIAAFVKYLVSYAATGHDVPGLAAMMPNSPFVKTINTFQPGQPGPGTHWFVVSSNFHVTLFDDSHHPPEFPRELAVKLAEGLVDQLFKGDNDLVVDQASMSAIGLPGDHYVEDTLDFGTNDEVYHGNYFSQQRFVDALSHWLQPAMAVGAEPEAEHETGADNETRIEKEAESEGESGQDEHDRGIDMAGPASPAPESPPPPAPMSPPPPPTISLPPTGSGGRRPGANRQVEESAEPTDVGAGKLEERAEATPAQLAAEMPATLTPAAPFTVRVRLSRKALAASEGTSHSTENVVVLADRPLTVQVIGKQNVRMESLDPDVFDLPAGGGISELQFTGTALAAGPVGVTVVVRQGRVPIATMTLQAEAVTLRPKTVLGDVSPIAQAVVHAGIDAPELEGLPCIDIVERTLPGGQIVYQYAVRVVKGEPARIFESLPMADRDTKVGKALDQVDATVRATADSPAEQLAALQDIGSTLFRQFFQPDLQAYLWEHRDELTDLILYADEPYVPWELVHLRPPTGPRPETPRFLAEGGLVRWQLGSFPPRQIRVREGRARSICPVYADPSLTNQQGQQEAAFLQASFHAKEVSATPAAVRDLLRGGRFDLLHFTGHGAASTADIADARVLLQGRLRGRTVEQQYLAAITVSENAHRAKGPGPLVVLNACQTGRTGELFTTVGGFAKAFLDAGASAFVSCLWSVHEEPARVFVETLYERLLAGDPMSVASIAARSAARDAGDPTWLAYVVYARPDAVLART
ncbi:MAG: CHAT domain-containing protein [Humibacillus sp.]|nr:CHAT domain-containing protein [Humibacillus sp.]MDN5776856.1 CHAT domain-containing protein [Humibacillus sp.]